MARSNKLPRRDLETAEAVIKLSFLIQSVMADVANEYGFTNVQLRTLGILRDRSLTMGELGRAMALEKSSVTILVDRAVDMELIRRTPSARDRRSVDVTLTAKGHVLDGKVRAKITSRVYDVLKSATSAAQRAEFTRVVRAIVEPLLPEPT